jgi:hypothetical protein
VAQPNYFPLHVSNQWVYRCSGFCGNAAPALQISKAAEFNGRAYFLLKGFAGQETWLRQDERGTLWAFDPETNQESRWYSFFAAEGESFDTSLDPCSTTATIASRSATYSGPIGDFENALHIAYPPGQCADAGLTEEFFLSWVGLVRRTEITIGGPRTYNLIYSRIGGVTVIAEKRLSFSLTLDRSLYYANRMPPVHPRRSVAQMTARLTLRNSTDQPVRLTFPSGQRFDLELRNEQGHIVHRWSDGKAFPMVLGEETIAAGAEKNYVAVARLADRAGKPLPPGKYVATAWLTTMGPRTYAASVTLEIRHVF